MIATERLYRTVTGEVVREGDPAAAFLLCIPGEEIPAGFEPPVERVNDAADEVADKPAKTRRTRSAPEVDPDV